MNESQFKINKEQTKQGFKYVKKKHRETSATDCRIKVTHKRQKIVGSQTFVDSITGEIVPMQIVEVEDRDFNFHKVWLQHLISSLDEITNKKMELAFWILDNLDRENKLVMTQRAIAEKSGLSLDTVSKTLKALQNGNPPFLVKINSGAYMVNPDIIWKGSHQNRMGIVFNYSQSKKQEEERNQQEEEINSPQSIQIDKEQTTLSDMINACSVKAVCHEQNCSD